MGFAPDKYMSKKEFENLETEEKKKTLNDTIILNEEQIQKYKYLYSENNKYIYNEYSYEKNGFKAKINSIKDTLALYTIPYDSGWSATVNGKEVEIEQVDNGFMAIKINKGENNIEFKYFPPGLKIGIIISSVSVIIFIIYGIFQRKGVKKYEKRK